MKIPLAELIRDLRSERVGQGRKNIIGNDGSTQSSVEQSQMRTFASLATNPSKWRLAMAMAKFAPLLAPFARFLPLLKHWTKYRSFPTINAGFHKKVANLQGVIYE